MQSELEGDIDLNGFLGLNPETPKGFTDIRARFKVKAAPEDIEAIKSLTSFSPGFNTLVNGTEVHVDVDSRRQSNTIWTAICPHISMVGRTRMSDRPDSYQLDVRPWVERIGQPQQLDGQYG